MRSAEFTSDYELQLFVEDITQITLSDGSVVDVEKLGSDTSIDKLPDDASDEIRLQKANELAERIAAGEGTEADYKVRIHQLDLIIRSPSSPGRGRTRRRRQGPLHPR